MAPFAQTEGRVMDGRGFLTREQVCQRYVIASATLTEWMRERGFPRPSRAVTRKRQAWREKLLDDYDRRLELAGAARG